MSPRLKHACRLYASAAVPTKREAAEAVGLNPSYFNVITQPGHAKAMPEAIELIDEIQAKIQDKTVDLSSIIQLVSREAVDEMRALLKESKNEAIRLKAASDILDRNPETSKTQKHQVSSFSLTGEDAKSLAAALVMSARAQQAVAPVTGDFIRIPTEQEEEAYTDAGQRLLTSALRQVDKVGDGNPSSPDGQGVEVHNLRASQASGRPAPEDPAPPSGRSLEQ